MNHWIDHLANQGARFHPDSPTQIDDFGRTLGTADLEQGFVAAVTGLAGSRDWPATFSRARAWYEPVLEEAHEDAAVRLLDLLQLEQIAAGYPSRERFLTELTLDPPEATSDLSGPGLKDEDYLILSTIHSAKGQEWKPVYVLNVVGRHARGRPRYCDPAMLHAGPTGAERD